VPQIEMDIPSAMEFTPEMIEICGKIMLKSYDIVSLSVQLLNLLQEMENISDADTYMSVKDNKSLMNLLRTYLKAKLPTNLQNSRYGLGFVCDFDLCHNMMKQADLVGFIKASEEFKRREESLSHDTYNMLISDVVKSRTNLMQLIIRTHNTIVSNWDLPGTPPKPRASRTKAKGSVFIRSYQFFYLFSL